VNESAIARLGNVVPTLRGRRWLGYSLGLHALAIVIFAVVTLSFFFPEVRGDTLSDVSRREFAVYPWAGAPPDTEYKPVLHYDQADSVFPWQVFVNDELRSGHFPLWNPYSFAGTPFFANGQNGVLYPPRLALSYTVSPTRVHDIMLSTHFFLAGVAMFLLLAYAGLAFPAALVGALAWMMNSFALAWQALEHYVAIGVWLPVSVLLIDLTVRRRSWAGTCALALSLGLLFAGGNVLFVELAIAATFGYGIALALLDGRRARRALGGNVLRLGIAAGLAFGLAAVMILPTLALADESARVSVPYARLADFRLLWRDLSYLFRPPPDPTLSDPYHHDLFAGAAIAALALVGCFRRRALAVFSVVLGVLAILFMLHTPVTRVVTELLPGFGNFKPLARAAFLLQFSLAVLAAFGLDLILRRIRQLRGRPGDLGRKFYVGAFVAAAVAVSVFVQEWRWRDSVMLHQPASAQFLYPVTPLIEDLQTRPGQRFLQTSPAFRGATTLIFSLESAGGYESLLPSRVQNLWRAVGDGIPPAELASQPLISAYHTDFHLAAQRTELLRRAGIALVVSPPASSEPGRIPRGLRLVYNGHDGRVFKVHDPLPRAYAVGRCEQVSSPLAALERFVDPSFVPGNAVVLERPALHDAGLTCSGGAAGRAGEATVLRRSQSSLLVLANMSRPGWLVLNDSWEEGWTATVDGHKAEVLPANSAFRAVRLSAGEHNIELRYEPISFELGVTLSSVSLGLVLGGLVLVFWRWRRAKPSSASGTRRRNTSVDRGAD
jgi:hypothetical protein